jgi:hypothetical protein
MDGGSDLGRQAHLREESLNPWLDLLLGSPCHLKGKGHIPFSRPARKEPKVLKHEAHPPTDFPEFPRGGPLAGEPTDPDLAGGGPFSQVNEAKAGGLPGPGVSGKENELPLGDMEVHVFQGGPGPRVGFGDVKEFYHKALAGMDPRMTGVFKLPLAS